MNEKEVQFKIGVFTLYAGSLHSLEVMAIFVAPGNQLSVDLSTVQYLGHWLQNSFSEKRYDFTLHNGNNKINKDKTQKLLLETVAYKEA